MSGRTLEQLLERLNDLYEDELVDSNGDADISLVIRRPMGERYRLSVEPNHHGWRSDIGDAYATEDEMIAFMDALEKAYFDDIEVKAATPALYDGEN